MTDTIIRKETAADFRTTETLTREAFWNVYRPGALEHFVLHSFRSSNAFIPELSLVLEKNGVIIGHIMYAKGKITADDGSWTEVFTFGPFSIAPHYRSKGYGTQLLQYSLQKAKQMGAKGVVITGDINLYGRYGFVVAKTKGIVYKADPDAEYFLAKELQTGFFDSVNGSYTDPQEYFADEKQAEEFDKTFPPKQKLRLPTQLG